MHKKKELSPSRISFYHWTDRHFNYLIAERKIYNYFIRRYSIRIYLRSVFKNGYEK